MINKTKILHALNNKFDATLAIENLEEDANSFRIRISGFEKDEGLYVQTKLSLATIQSQLISEKYSGNTNEILSKKINENFLYFLKFYEKLIDESYDILININDTKLDIEKAIGEKKIPLFNFININLKKAYDNEKNTDYENLAILISEKVLNFLFLFFPTAQKETDDTVEGSLIEGYKTKITVNKYERDPLNRRRCLEHHGYRCKVCNLSFKDSYGEIGEGFIHVHHIIPVSKLAIEKDYKINPIEDLIPVCPNCHYMLHKKDDIPYTVEELKNIIKNLKNEKNN